MIRTLLLDVDGVIADFCGGVDLFAAQIGAPASEWLHWKLEDNFPEHKQAILEAVRAVGFAYRLPEVPLAVEAVRKLLAAGCVRVVFVTAPMSGSATWCSERVQWLEERFGPVEIVFASKKDLIKGDLFVDDNPDNVRSWWDANPTAKAYLVRRPYNKVWHSSAFCISGIEKVVVQ